MRPPESIGPSGFGWTGSWASTGFRRIARQAGRSSNAGSKHAAWRKPARMRSSHCAGVGAGEVRNSKQQLLARMEGQLGDHHSGELKRETADARTERIMAEELARLGWSKQQLAQKPKSDPGKLAIAARLRSETILTIRQIAAKLQMGSWKSANSRLHYW